MYLLGIQIIMKHLVKHSDVTLRMLQDATNGVVSHFKKNKIRVKLGDDDDEDTEDLVFKWEPLGDSDPLRRFVGQTTVLGNLVFKLETWYSPEYVKFASNHAMSHITEVLKKRGDQFDVESFFVKVDKIESL